MYEYFQIGIVLFLLWCLIVPILSRAPSRLKFYITIIAMVAWIVPWQLVSLNIPFLAKPEFSQVSNEKVLKVSALVESFYRDSQAPSNSLDPKVQPSVVALVQSGASEGFSLSGLTAEAFLFIVREIYAIIIGGLLIGVLMFVLDLLKFRRQLSIWQRNSRDGSDLARSLSIKLGRVKLRILPRSAPGMATGIGHPTIWLSDDVRDSEHQKTIILHELVHIQHNDTKWIWLINFSKRLLWWNPIVLLLSRRAVDYMEYSCDEACNRQLDDSKYRASLAALIIGHERTNSMTTVLGINKAKNLNVLRVKALETPRQLGFIHIFAACAAASLAVFACVVLLNKGYYNAAVSAFLKAQPSTEHVSSLVEVPPSEAVFFRFAEYVRHENYPAAEEIYHELLEHYEADQDFEIYDQHSRILAFRIMAMYLGDTDQYQAILDLYPKMLKPEWVLNVAHLTRILAIVNIRLQNFDTALKLLKDADALESHGGPSKVLLAQVYHLLGDYRASAEVSSRYYPEFSHNTNYYESKIALLRLLGKNLILLGDDDGLKRVKAELGDYAPKDFMAVRADQPRIPYVYFNYHSVAGVDVQAVDEDQFPLPEHAPQTEVNALKRIFDLAAIHSRYQQYDTAIKVVSDGFEMLKDEISTDEKTKALEYIFVLHILAGDMTAAAAAAVDLKGEEGLNPSVLARVYYVLAMAGSKETLDDTTKAYFDKYLAMLNAPSLAADHETIKIYSEAENPEPAQEAVNRILSFYQTQALVPDIRILNSIIGIFENLGRQEEAKSFRAVLAANYPRAYNFIYE